MVFRAQGNVSNNGHRQCEERTPLSEEPDKFMLLPAESVPLVILYAISSAVVASELLMPSWYRARDVWPLRPTPGGITAGL